MQYWFSRNIFNSSPFSYSNLYLLFCLCFAPAWPRPYSFLRSVSRPALTEHPYFPEFDRTPKVSSRLDSLDRPHSFKIPLYIVRWLFCQRQGPHLCSQKLRSRWMRAYANQHIALRPLSWPRACLSSLSCCPRAEWLYLNQHITLVVWANPPYFWSFAHL
jgi:hypothetical protein